MTDAFWLGGIPLLSLLITAINLPANAHGRPVLPGFAPAAVERYAAPV